MAGQVLYSEIVTDHRERMLNLKKYYPFFKLSEVSFSWFQEGKYDNLDMGYILMAVLRFFIEENNFKERDVTYAKYAVFMEGCLRRDFGIVLDEENLRILVDYIFDKLKNDGKPFTFEYYDPAQKQKKMSRIKLLESRIEDGTVYYSISSDAIEFYLDTKEIKDESKITVEQLLLEKMIRSNNFSGGTQVIKRINEEVKRLWYRRDKVLDLLGSDVFAGVEEYRNFVDTGIKWFDEEQRLFVRNKELIEAALRRAKDAKIGGDAESFYKAGNEIYKLDTELKVAMNNHSELLKACTQLSVRADEIVRKAKVSRFKKSFDHRRMLEKLVSSGDPTMLIYLVKPLFAPNVRRSFDIAKVDDILSYRPDEKEKAESVSKAEQQQIVFKDEEDEKRMSSNFKTLIRIMLDMLAEKKEITLREFDERARQLIGRALETNGDYYVFLVHLAGQSEFLVKEIAAMTDDIIEIEAGHSEDIEFAPGAYVTDFTMRVKNGNQKS